MPIRGRLASGLGQDSVLEVGLALHHTYRTPIIRGSSLKGLAASYCRQVWSKDPLFADTGDGYLTLFGTTESAGFIHFHDAWITPACLKAPNQGLVRDVMTPHHGPYYGEKTAETAPTDFDEPNPVTFLSVAGTFRFALECSDPSGGGRKWGNLALQLLVQALSKWGAGGKTNAGYGRFEAK